MRLSALLYSRPISLPWLIYTLCIFSQVQLSHSIQLDLNDDESIKTAAGQAAHGLLLWYKGNETGQTPGLLPQPYYWWESGAMMMSLIDYWSYTGDSQYNDLVTKGMLHQVGPKWDFMTPNQTKTTGNDDQAFWGMAAMGAAESKFADPPEDQPQWLALAQAVFNTQAVRWDTEYCGGGLRWQVFPFNTGWNYKNTISTGAFFNIAARLARYTGNTTYSDWAAKAWDWSMTIGLLSEDCRVFDGSDLTINCTEINHLQWTYNAGIFLHGAANMYSVNKSDIWRTRVNTLHTALDIFFFNNTNIMHEQACEQIDTCNQDQRSFKAYLSRWMAATTQLCPWLYDPIMARLSASAAAAALQCSGGDTGQVCGLHWTDGAVYDGWYGPGEQMAAMAVIGANLVKRVAVPVTVETGGTSVGNPNAGTSVTTVGEVEGVLVIKTADRAGAWVLTGGVLGAVLAGAAWTCI